MFQNRPETCQCEKTILEHDSKPKITQSLKMLKFRIRTEKMLQSSLETCSFNKNNSGTRFNTENYRVCKDVKASYSDGK